MTDITMASLVPEPTRTLLRYLRRRAGDDKADRERRRPAGSYDPAATAGVGSEHYRRRIGDDKMAAAAVAAAAAAALAAKLPPPVAWDASAVRTNVDEATPELRRRIFEVAATARPRRLSPAIGWWFAGGLSAVLWVGIGELIYQL